MEDEIKRAKELERYAILISMLNFLYDKECMSKDERITEIEYNEIRKKMKNDYHIISDVYP
ncbi:hypothetical protein [Propionispira raffinosivorans]|uniref:hypothetical protein n=1 Tax=Propionispira raffinosivorans TaxID=86959 RepID=UPI00035E2B2B|nr:hypothetical protein [Propionispira raffinosivorans]